MIDPLERLRQIADEMRGLPFAFRILPDANETGQPPWDGETTDPHSLGPVGGQLLSDAIDLGAFAGVEYSEIRTLRQHTQHRFPNDWATSFFCLAIARLVPTLRDTKPEKAQPSLPWQEVCNTVADLLETDIQQMACIPAKTNGHSMDFRSVYWFGTEYNFTPNQAIIVKLLYEAWENKTPDVCADCLVTEADIQATDSRLSVIFRGNDAWGTMIVPGKTRGTYRLQETAKQTQKKSSARPKMRS